MSTVLSVLQENAQRFPNHPAVSDTVQTVSYEELWQKAQKFAAWLTTSGLSNGAKIVVEARPSVAFVISAVGVHLAGCALVPAEKNVSYGVALRLVQETEARLFLGQEKINGVLGLSSESILERTESSEGVNFTGKMPEENSIAEILYTTGTTGSSKGAILSHRSVFASADNSYSMERLNTDSVYLIASPLNHIAAFQKIYACFLAGAHAILLDGFLDVKKYYETIERYRVNTLLLPPSAVRFLLLVSQEKLSALAEQIKSTYTSGAPMTEREKETLRRCLPHSRLVFGYGATEAGHACCAYDYAEFPGKTNCIGKPSSRNSIAIVDETHCEIDSSPENLGYLAIAGESLMNGYLNNPALTSEVLRDNRAYTQDLGYIDQDGFVFVLGRKGDIINVGGLKVAPAEVENAAMRYPEIRDCACFGVQDRIAGTAVKLNIVLKDGVHFDLTAFRKFLQNHLESHQVPTQIECVTKIPKTPNGKIDRKRLQ